MWSLQVFFFGTYDEYNSLLFIVVVEQILCENTEGQKALVLWPAFDVFMALVRGTCSEICGF